MAATVLWNKSPYMKELMAQADPPKEASKFATMNGRPQLLFSNEMTHFFIEWATTCGLLKKNILPFDAPNRPSWQQLFLKTTVPWKKTKAKLKTPQWQLFGESSCCESHACKSKCLQLLF